MDVDAIVRRACLVAVPALAVTAYFLRRAPPNQRKPPIASAAAPGMASSPPIEPELDPLPNDGPRRAEPGTPAPALPPVRPEPPPSLPQVPRARAAVDLPPAAPSTEAVHRARHHGACGGIEARLITTSDDPKWSFATLAVGSDDPGAIRHIGDRVGNWRVAGIEWDRVLLRAGGHHCSVPLFAGAEADHKAHGAHGGLTFSAAAGAAPRWFVPESIASAIDQRSETEYLLSPQAVAAIFKRAADLMSGLGLKTVRQDGKVIGLRLRHIPIDSLLDRLGLQQNDVLLALNGTPAASLDDVKAALEKARDQGTLIAHLERQDQAFDLSIREGSPGSE